MRTGARLARAGAFALLSRITWGSIEVREEFRGGAVRRFGAAAGPAVSVRVLSPEVYPLLLRRRSLGLAEGYGEGLWDTDDLVGLGRIAARGVARFDPLRTRMAPLLAPAQRLARLDVRNTRRRARRNIAAHYDLGNDLFELFLDRDTMMYSAAVFERPDEPLEVAQRRKLDRLCRALALRPDDHLLEIGTGWGGLAVHAASRYGCRVTTTTISREQRSYAEARVRAAGLEDRVTVLGSDYRELTGTYDKLVSVEMIEAVGWEYLEEFFRRSSALLRPEGLMCLQAIVIDDRAYEAEKAAPSFANELIFPGGCLPSLEVLQRCVARATDMRTLWLEDISAGYALTLARWRERFAAAEDELEELGYDGRFRRLWSLWLALSEAGFREARISDLQILYAKPGWRPDPLGEVGGQEGVHEHVAAAPADRHERTQEAFAVKADGLGHTQ